MTAAMEKAQTVARGEEVRLPDSGSRKLAALADYGIPQQRASARARGIIE